MIKRRIMKNLLLAVLFAGAAVSCVETSVVKGNGKTAKAEFDVDPDYSALAVASGITLKIIPAGTGWQGAITADEMVLDYVCITQKNGEIRVSYDPGISVRSKVETVVTIPASRELKSIAASSAARLECDTRLVCTTLNVKAGSAATIDLDAETPELTVDMGSAAKLEINGAFGVCKISGGSASNIEGRISAQEFSADLGSAATCELEGATLLLTVDASSASNFKGYDFLSKTANVRASSAGTVRVNVADELAVKVSSGASVSYKGSPNITASDVSSGGSLKKVN